MNDLRQATITAINLLRVACEFAPKAEEITSGYVDVWEAAFADAKISPQEVVLSARQWNENHPTYPAANRIVKIALERREHRISLAQANYVIQQGRALPMGKVTDEDRAAARARLGIGPEDVSGYKRQVDRDRGNVGGRLTNGLGVERNAVLPKAPQGEVTK